MQNFVVPVIKQIKKKQKQQLIYGDVNPHLTVSKVKVIHSCDECADLRDNLHTSNLSSVRVEILKEKIWYCF